MPLIEIHAPPQPDSVDIVDVCREINAAVAAAIPCRPDAVWTTWRTIDGAYVRGAVAGGATGDRTFGPIVHVYLHRTAEETQRTVDAIEEVLARALAIERSEVFVTTQPVAIDDPTLA